MSPATWTVERTCYGERVYSRGNGDCTLKQWVWFGMYSGKRKWTSSHQRRTLTALYSFPWRNNPPCEWCARPPLAEGAQICVSARKAPPSSAVQDQGGEGNVAVGHAEMAHAALVLGPIRTAVGTALDNSTEEGPSVSSGGLDLASPTRTMGSTCLAAQRSSPIVTLPQRMLDTITEARAPSTRRLYAHKWRIFETWCSSRMENPVSCPTAVILSFLQECLDAGHAPSTLKVYVAAISAYHNGIDKRSVGRNDLVIKFLWGARRMNPPARPLSSLGI